MIRSETVTRLGSSGTPRSSGRRTSESMTTSSGRRREQVSLLSHAKILKLRQIHQKEKKNGARKSDRDVLEAMDMLGGGAKR